MCGPVRCLRVCELSGDPSGTSWIWHPPPASAQRAGRPTSRAEDGECPWCGGEETGPESGSTLGKDGLFDPVVGQSQGSSWSGHTATGAQRLVGRVGRTGCRAPGPPALGSTSLAQHCRRPGPRTSVRPRGRHQAEHGLDTECGKCVELLAAAWPVRRGLPWSRGSAADRGLALKAACECSQAAYVQGARVPACRAGTARHCERQGLVLASVSRRVSSLHWTPGPWRKAVFRAPPLTRGEADAPQGLCQHRPRAEPSCCWPGPSRPAESRLQPWACGWFTQGGSPEEGRLVNDVGGTSRGRDGGGRRQRAGAPPFLWPASPWPRPHVAPSHGAETLRCKERP